MAKRKKALLQQCVNGCKAPPCPPSRMLCKACLAALDRKMRALGASRAAVPGAGEGAEPWLSRRGPS